MNKKVGALVCTCAGHRWAIAEDEETHAGLTLLRCGRCGAESVVSAETFEAEGWLERAARDGMAHNPYIDPGDVDPRIRERRR